MEVKNYNYKMLNVMKFVCAILVVMIHTMALNSISEDLWVATSLGICRIAVPFFFVISGYFYYEVKIEKERRNRIKKYWIIYLKCVGLELILLLPMVIVVSKSLPIYIIGFRLLMIGVTGSLWYVFAMVLGFLVLEFFVKRKKYMLLMGLSVVVFVFGLMGDSYGGLFVGTSIEKATNTYKMIFFMMQAGIVMSVPFLTIGYLINKLNIVEKAKNNTMVCLVSGVVLLIEVFTLYKLDIALDYNLYISLIIFVPTLFIFIVKSNMRVSDKVSEYTRRGSFLVYILHQPIMLLMMASGLSILNNTVIKFIITIIVTFCVTWFALSFNLDKYLVKK